MPLQIPWENFAEPFGSVEHRFGNGCSIVRQDTTAETFVHELAEKVRPLDAALSIACEGGLSNYHLSPPF
jgi:hypothetical protein